MTITLRRSPAWWVQALPAVSPARKRWLVPAIAVAVTVLVATVTMIILTTGGGDAGQTRAASPPPPPPPPPPPLRLYDHGGAVVPYQSLIGSQENWTGTEVGAAGARRSSITAEPDSGGGLHVEWTGSAAAQIYLWRPASEDLKSYVDSAGALVFTTVVYEPPVKRTKVAVHCGYSGDSCRAVLEARTLFRDLTAGQPKTIKIPLSCFVAKGLNPAGVNTPFLVYSEGAFKATFSDIRWVPGAGRDSDATPCDGPS